VRPALAVGVEDAFAQQRTESPVTIAQAEILKPEREDRLDVLRLDGYNGGHAQQFARVSVGGHHFEAALCTQEQFLVPAQTEVLQHQVET